MYIIVGLGNPGLRYQKTRHNMGFMTIDRLAEKTGTKVSKLKFKAKVGEGNISGRKVIFVKPQTFMNLSGNSVREVMDYYKTEKDHLILIYDDLDLDVGRIRLRAKGSAGTHNGMRSVVAQLGYSDFPRIRIGIGDPENKDAIGHVIGKISKNEKEILSDAVDKAADAAVSIITDGIERAMNIFNGNN